MLSSNSSLGCRIESLGTWLSSLHLLCHQSSLLMPLTFTAVGGWVGGCMGTCVRACIFTQWSTWAGRQVSVGQEGTAAQGWYLSLPPFHNDSLGHRMSPCFPWGCSRHEGICICTASNSRRITRSGVATCGVHALVFHSSTHWCTICKGGTLTPDLAMDSEAKAVVSIR